MSVFLTDAMRRFLTAIRDSEDEYAIQEGIEVWVGLERFSAATVNKCLQFCLISGDPYASEGTHIWVLNEDGRKILEDDKYVPEIVKALARRRG